MEEQPTTNDESLREEEYLENLILNSYRGERSVSKEELADILKSWKSTPPKGFDDKIYAKKIEAYAQYLLEKFEYVDKKLFDINKFGRDNKRCKGELLLAGILDLTMWRFGFQLGFDYQVEPQYYIKKGGNTVDFKLTCNNKVFLCEAKNWAETTIVTETNYKDDYRTRFFDDGINILMVGVDKIESIERWYNKHGTLNNKPINYIAIDNFMDALDNRLKDITYNLISGTTQMSQHLLNHMGVDRDFDINDCLKMGMPSEFIAKYMDKSIKTVNRAAKDLVPDRRSSKYKNLIKYRKIRWERKKKDMMNPYP